jgi:hypothetical protein
MEALAGWRGWRSGGEDRGNRGGLGGWEAGALGWKTGLGGELSVEFWVEVGSGERFDGGFSGRLNGLAERLPSIDPWISSKKSLSFGGGIGEGGDSKWLA